MKMTRNGAIALLVGQAALLVACGGSLMPASGAGGTSGRVAIGGATGGGASAGSGTGSGTAGVGAGGNVTMGTGGTIVILPQPDRPLGDGCQNCTKAPINRPTWEPIEVAMVSIPLAVTDDYRAAVETLLAPFHPRDRTAGAFGPGVPHLFPRTELRDLLARSGLTPRQFFSPYETGPQRSILILMTVGPGPDAAIGRSPDLDVGPIIPNAVFPMRVEFTPSGPSIFDTYDLKVPRYDSYDPPIVADGPSHFVIAFRANNAFDVNNPYLYGRFQLQVRIVDATGAGWDAGLNFTIYPDEVP